MTFAAPVDRVGSGKYGVMVGISLLPIFRTPDAPLGGSLTEVKISAEQDIQAKWHNQNSDLF
jgi:hypothetical protein